MRSFINIVEAEDFDYGDDFDIEDQPIVPPKPYQFLSSLDRYKALKHDARKDDREKWRRKQQKRFNYDTEDADETPFMSKRSIQKSVVGYKPFKFPLIRFGKFGKASRNFLPAEMRHEMGNVTHEAGVSCYMGAPNKDGYTFYLPHPDRASYDVTHWEYRPTDNDLKGLWGYLQNGTPMDIFLIHGHLVSYGEGNSWLDLGSDGEYMLDTSKPYNKEILSPEKVYPSRNHNLVQYVLEFTFRKGISGLRDYIQSQEDGDPEDDFDPREDNY